MKKYSFFLCVIYLYKIIWIYNHFLSKSVQKHFNKESPKTNIHHLIWNVLLTDKLTKLNQEIITNNKIKQGFLKILTKTVIWSQKKDDFIELNKEIPDFPYDILEYGEKHDTTINFDQYNKYAQEIDKIARNGESLRNVLIFCNNGYQRSLPFIVYYLTKYHPEEFPSIDKAVEMILSQLDRDNFMKIKNNLIECVSKLLNS